MVTIYALTCLANNKAYIGCTTGKLAKRMREHRCLLRCGKHSEKLLLEDWQRYGEQAFAIHAVEVFLWDDSLETRRKAETYWMAHYDARGLLYNTNRTSFAPKPEAQAKGQPKATATIGRKWSPEANEKRRLAQLGKPKGHGAKISATKRAKQLMR